MCSRNYLSVGPFGIILKIIESSVEDVNEICNEAIPITENISHKEV